MKRNNHNNIANEHMCDSINQSNLHPKINYFMNLERLSRDMIHEICKYLDVTSTCKFNLTSKELSRKITYYMIYNLVYKCRNNKMITNMKRSNNNKYKTIHLEHIKKIEIDCMDILKFFGNNIKYIYFDGTFYKDIDKYDFSVYPNLEKISFGEQFSGPIENIKFPNLEELSFGEYFNHPIEKLHCPNLKKLSFGKSFNHPIENLHCPNLEELSFGKYFDNPMEKLHCPNLKKIKFGFKFSHTITNFHCPNLKELHMHMRQVELMNLKMKNDIELKIYYLYNQNERDCQNNKELLMKKYPNYKISMYKW